MLKPWSHELSIQEPCFMFRNGTTRSRDNSETCARLIPIFFKKTLRCVETGIETPINFDLIVVSRVWSVTILLLKSSSSESFLIPVPFSDKWKRLKASWTNVSPAPWCEQPQLAHLLCEAATQRGFQISTLLRIFNAMLYSAGDTILPVFSTWNPSN